MYAEKWEIQKIISIKDIATTLDIPRKDISKFTVMRDNVEYTVNASNIESVTAGHIHSGKQGENGPVVVTLFKNDSPTNEVSETGSITADKLEGPVAGNN